MATVIWKTKLADLSVQDIQVPVGAEFLCAREQHDAICVWYRCNPDMKKEARKIAIDMQRHCDENTPCHRHSKTLATR